MAIDYEECNACKNGVVWYSFFSNLGLVFFKGILGFVAGSAGLIADAFHSLTDVVSCIVTIISLKISDVPRDKSHPYGHGKIQFISSGFVSFVLLSGAIMIFVIAASSLLSGNIKHPHPIALAGAIISIGVNEIMFRFQRCVADKSNSPAILANAWDDRGDALSSLAVFLGILGAQFGYNFLDPLAALLVSIIIIKVGVGLGWNAIKGLIDSSPPIKTIKKVHRLVMKTPEIHEVSSIRGRFTGDRLWIEVGIKVDEDLKVAEGDKLKKIISNKIAKEIEHVGQVDVYIEPCTVIKNRKFSLKRFKLFKSFVQIA